ncbi:sigma-54 interaction domain-containing protein [Bacilliculturomica massiliensis]|uniref:sigma-54 interaction domain-containing protein n=1 Tax=Bacilliculturomica massiliensis TaxID=1917867 RepID=UPI0010304B81|nr:sigma 54-interacting transcriptional regulator [Bacilliculturomica massiliensis]
MKRSGRKEKIAADILLETMLSAVDELIVIVDKEGYIEALSKAYAEFLGVNQKTVVGRHVSEVIENTRMDIVTKTGIPETGEFQQIKGEKMIASRIPIYKDGEILGAFGRVLFRSMGDLRMLYEKMNSMELELSLYKKTFGKINTARYSVDDITGNCDLMRDLKETVKKVAKTNSSVLILGESGTGKELFAHAVHQASMRKSAPFICVNCGTIPSQLIESELFGYEEGSFTGAKKGGKTGLFQAAHGGTIFLDEIGDLPLDMQVKLLRVLQDKEIQKIGSNVREPVNVRVVAATNKSLYKMVQEDRFRSDLYYRLNVVTLHIPALRERKEDIPFLARIFIQKFARRENLTVEGVSKGAMEYLMRYDWPGNVRELENVLERAINFIGSDGKIKVEHLPSRITGLEADFRAKTLKETMEESERLAIVGALMRSGNSKTKAARELGISRTTLYEKMMKYEIGSGFDG